MGRKKLTNHKRKSDTWNVIICLLRQQIKYRYTHSLFAHRHMDTQWHTIGTLAYKHQALFIQPNWHLCKLPHQSHSDGWCKSTVFSESKKLFLFFYSSSRFLLPPLHCTITIITTIFCSHTELSSTSKFELNEWD